MGNISLFQKRPHVCALPVVRAQRGIGMLQLMVILAALAALVVGLSYKTSDYFSKSQALDSDALLRLADNQLRQYIAANGRLPCPALDGTGVAPATCTLSQQKGYLPYKTLGMAENNYVYGEVPMLYGVYNDGTINFTSDLQVFIPTFADKANASKPVNNPRNIFDFCASLEALQGKNGALQSTGLSIAAQYNAVFALALPGKANRDGLGAGGTGWTGDNSGLPSINAQYDGLNALNATQFELPEKQVSPTYDDRTAFRGPTDLHDYLRCEAMNNSISLLTEAVTMQQEVEDFADANDESATMGIVMNAVGIALATWEVIQDIAAIAEASEQIGIASALLATNTALCPLPPWVTCALIPVNVTALVSASVGLGLSIGAAVSAGIGLGLEIAATIFYADVKQRTTRPHPVYNQSTTPTDTGITADRLAKLKLNYVTSRDAAVTAFKDIPPAPAISATQLNTNQQNAANVVSADIAAVTDAQLGSLLSNVLNGTSVVCSSPYTGCDKTQVPVLNSPSTYLKVNPDGTTSSCNPAAHTPSTWCTDNGYSLTQMSIVWSKVDPASGAVVTCADTASTCKANGYSAAGQPTYSTVYVKSGLAAPYSPGVVPSVDNYYQTTKTTVNPDGSTNTPKASDISAALSASNTAVSAYGTLLAAIADFDQINLKAYQAAVALPVTALLLTKTGGVNELATASNTAWANYQNYLNTHCATAGCTSGSQSYDPNYSANSQSFLTAYNNAYSAWNTANNNYNQVVTNFQVAYAGRSTALDTLNNAMGTTGWDNTSHTSLCGGGVTTGCGWMVGAGSGAVNGQARTGSSVVNAYLNAYETYRDADAYAAKKKAADAAAANAWSDRNSFKSAACQVNGAIPPWVGSAYASSISSDPQTWDAYAGAALSGGRDGNNLYAATWAGSGTAIASAVSAGGTLKCDGGPTQAQLQAKYCTQTSPDYNVDACKQYSPPATSNAVTPIIQDPAGIVDILIQKGIAL